MLSVKPITAFLIATCLLVASGVYSQRVNLSFNKAPLKKVFKAIEKQTGYTFFYQQPLMEQANKVTVHINDVSLLQALDLCFKDQPLDYVIAGNIITIRKKAAVLPAGGGPLLSPPLVVKGVVINANDEPVPGATIMVKGGTKQTAADDNGTFMLAADSNAIIVVSSINYEKEEIPLAGRRELVIHLVQRVAGLDQVLVVGATGYQRIGNEKITGSLVTIDSALFNRRVSTNVLDRLEGVTSGLVFNKNIISNVNQSSMSIRGRSTLFANPEPLIVLDNFPYTGDINNINPNDIESVSVLKDAAAASIWGAYSGNGVIVISTRKGKYNQTPRISVTSNVTVTDKLNLRYLPVLGSADYISVEQFLFGKSVYDDWPANPLHRPISPAVEIMLKQRSGALSDGQAEAQLNQLRNHSIYDDLDKYFFRKSVNQQYAFSLSGGGASNQYYFSAGYDKNLSAQVGNEYNRITLNADNTYALIKRKLELNTGIIFSAARSSLNDAATVGGSYPYTSLADDRGGALAVTQDLRQLYKDTAGRGVLLDWNYRPLDELRLSDNSKQLTDYRINLSLKYNILKDMNITVAYQYNKGSGEQQNFRSQATYFTRNLINQFTQVNGGTITRPVPLGGIMDKTTNEYEAHNIRAQFNYNHDWGGRHNITAIAGAEQRGLDATTANTRMYGYSKDRQTGTAVDYQTYFPLYYAPFSTAKITNNDLSSGTTDRFISFFSNLIYTWKRRYIVSASIRKDESNLFGGTANQRGTPLWSAGLGWNISREKFYHSRWLPFLKLRVTNGYNGNVDRSVSAFTTISVAGQNSYGTPVGSVVNPPNPSLRWEKVNIVNFGADFATRHNTVSGSIEYYQRRGKDLIGYSPLDPTTGNPSFRGNTADMKGSGVDVVINTKNNDKAQVHWSATFLFSYTTDEVTSYKVMQSSIAAYYNPTLFNPLPGRPLYSVYVLKWAGLDPQNGDPQGMLDGHVSKDYSSILNSADFNSLVYKGAANPRFFGSFRNTLGWKQMELSFLLTWKMGYYFRRNSVNYSDLFSSNSKGNTDLSRRWQKAGDEKITNVPSMVYPADPMRDAFYSYSALLAERGDHLRLQDIRLSYELKKEVVKKLPVRSVQLYLYANNIGLLWRANNKGIDPDYVNNIPSPRSLSAGVKVDF